MIFFYNASSLLGYIIHISFHQLLQTICKLSIKSKAFNLSIYRCSLFWFMRNMFKRKAHREREHRISNGFKIIFLAYCVQRLYKPSFLCVSVNKRSVVCFAQRTKMPLSNLKVCRTSHSCCQTPLKPFQQIIKSISDKCQHANLLKRNNSNIQKRCLNSYYISPPICNNFMATHRLCNIQLESK